MDTTTDSRKVTISMPNDQYERLRLGAYQLNMTKSGVIQYALRRLFDESDETQESPAR